MHSKGLCATFHVGLPAYCRCNQRGYRPLAGSCIPGKAWSLLCQWSFFHPHGNAPVHPAVWHSAWCDLVKQKRYSHFDNQSQLFLCLQHIEPQRSVTHNTHIHTIRSGRFLPVQLDDIIPPIETLPTRRCHSPWFVLTGGHGCNVTDASSETVPAPHSVLIGGEGLQVRVC